MVPLHHSDHRRTAPFALVCALTALALACGGCGDSASTTGYTNPITSTQTGGAIIDAATLARWTDEGKVNAPLGTADRVVVVSVASVANFTSTTKKHIPDAVLLDYLKDVLRTSPPPLDLFLASIATCAGIYVKGYCDTRGVATEGLGLEMQIERYPEKHRVVRLVLELKLPEGFPGEPPRRCRAGGGPLRGQEAHPAAAGLRDPHGLTPEPGVLAIPELRPARSRSPLGRTCAGPSR